MNQYPDYKTYRKLYQRFYDGGLSTAEFIETADPIINKNVVDICGGDGRIAVRAKLMNANFIALVEQETNMIPPETLLFDDLEVAVFNEPVHKAFDYFRENNIKFDIAFCQQAINYWLNETLARSLAQILTPGGIFVFNTFNKKPSQKMTIKEYKLNDDVCLEINWMIGEMVHHVQIREGVPCHTTIFQWISPERFVNILEPYFTVEKKDEYNSALYRCVRK